MKSTTRLELPRREAALWGGFAPRPVCWRCRRPRTACYCRYLTVLETRTRIVLLQHPRERDRAIGTAHMASLCLPNSELHVGIDWSSSNAVLRALSDPSRTPMLLYPGEGAVDVIQHPPAEPITLIVVDGTWPQTRKMIRKNPQIASLPRIAFDPPRPGQYRVRKEPNRACVSTIEALAYALGALEHDPARFTALLGPFHAMVKRQIACCRELHEGRIRHPKSRPSRPDPVLSMLCARQSDLLCVVGEANAWPYRAGEPRVGPEELVHWAAYRMATGEVFDRTAAPSGPVAPATPANIGLSRGTLEASADIADLLRAWQGFIRPTDVICAWGRYATSLLVASGGQLPTSRIDLRQVTRDLMKRRFGTMDTFLHAVGEESTPALASGRAGLRLAQLAAIARHWARVGARPGRLRDQ